jgi:hypothetical protein
MAQVTLGFLLPTLLLIQIECREFKQQRREWQQRGEQAAAQHSRPSVGAASARLDPPATAASPQAGDAGSIVGPGLANSSSGGATQGLGLANSSGGGGTQEPPSACRQRCQLLPAADRLYTAALRAAGPAAEGSSAIMCAGQAGMLAAAWMCICTVVS